MTGGKVRSKLPGSDCGGVWRSTEVSSTRQRSAWVNLKRSLRVGARLSGGYQLRSRLSMTSWMLPPCLFLFVVRMLRSQKDSLSLAVIFVSLLAVSQRSIDVWVRPGKSWIHLIMGCGAVRTCAGGRKSESSGPWCFQSCSIDVRLGLCPGI